MGAGAGAGGWGWAGLGCGGCGHWAEPEIDGLWGSAGAQLGLGRGGAGAGVLRLEPDLPKLGFATGNWFEFGFCDWNLVLGWVGLEIDGLGRSTAAMTSNFYLCLS